MGFGVVSDVVVCLGDEQSPKARSIQKHNEVQNTARLCHCLLIPWHCSRNHLHQTSFITCHHRAAEIHLNMSREYLNRLLSTPEHRVQGECVICLEPYNTLNTTTGIIEVEVRLSCGHTVGSACIVTWLRDNNSCPLCRETFFPRQPRPYLEHGVMDNGRQNTGRINATGSLRRESIVPRPVAIQASAHSRPRIFDAGRQRQVRLPTGPGVPRSSPIGDSGLGRSNTSRDTTGSEVLTGSDARNSTTGRSITVRVSTGSEADTDNIFRHLQDLVVGHFRDLERMCPYARSNLGLRHSVSTSDASNPTAGRSITVRVSTGSEALTVSLVRALRDLVIGRLQDLDCTHPYAGSELTLRWSVE